MVSLSVLRYPIVTQIGSDGVFCNVKNSKKLLCFKICLLGYMPGGHKRLVTWEAPDHLPYKFVSFTYLKYIMIYSVIFNSI